jgi:hypothetical protein
MGSAEFARALYEEFRDEFDTAIAIYKGLPKKFFADIADQLKIPTTEPKYNREGDEVGEKPLTMDGLKDEIAENIGDRTLLIFPESKRLTTGARYWLEDAIAKGVRVVCFAVVNPQRDIFLEMIEVELELPSDRTIRCAMEDEAAKLGLNLTPAQLSQLQPLAGKNPMLARKVVRQEKLGINQKMEHRQYLVMMPIILSALFSFAIIRYVGMGTGNKNWQIFGGVALTVAMAAKQLGRVEGAKKRLGQ